MIEVDLRALLRRKAAQVFVIRVVREIGNPFTSDTVENGEKEVALWFKKEELVDWKREVDRWVFEK